MKRTITLVLGLMSLLPLTVQADNLVMQFDFSDVSGTSVSDKNHSNLKARLMSGATVQSVGNYHVLNLGSANGYLDLTAAAGTLLAELTDYTVSVYYRIGSDVGISGNGYFLWAFSNSEANTATASPYSGYRVNAQRYATSTGGYQNETGMEAGSASPTGRWMHVLYRQKSRRGQLYINGVLTGTTANMPEYATIFTTAPAYNWIGRPPFASDIYLSNTLVTDFRVYNIYVDDDELNALAAQVDDLDYAYNFGTPGDTRPYSCR